MRLDKKTWDIQEEKRPTGDIEKRMFINLLNPERR
jgi:hypothetical protein